MEPANNHYRSLGLDISASRQAIREAVEALARQADALAYTSPERSRELWQQIRQIRSELLSTLDRRQTYDLALLQAITDQVMITAEPVQMVAAPPPVELVPVPPAEPGHMMPRWAPLAAVAAVVALAASVAAVTQSVSPHGAAVPKPAQRPVALAPNPEGSRAEYGSGETVPLRWHSTARAARYRLEIATGSAQGGLALFGHPNETITTTRPSYALRVVGAQQYSWRVRSLVHGRWSPYSRPTHFSVARPQANTPQLVAPEDYALLPSRQVRLCWIAEPGVSGYRLRVDRAPRAVTGRCTQVTVKRGFHHWSVASLVQGVKLYRSSYSRTGHFTVRPVTRPAVVARAPSARRVAAVAPANPQPVSSTPPQNPAAGGAVPAASAPGPATERSGSSRPIVRAPTRRPARSSRPPRRSASRPPVPRTGSRAPGAPTASHGPAPVAQPPIASNPAPTPPSQPGGVPAALPPTSVPQNVTPPASAVVGTNQRPARRPGGPNRATGVGMSSPNPAPAGRSVSSSTTSPATNPVPATSPAPAQRSAPSPAQSGRQAHGSLPPGQLPPDQRHP